MPITKTKRAIDPNSAARHELINARHGLSWGLMNVLRVQRGVMVRSDNTAYDQVLDSVGRESEWSQMSARVFGLRGDTLPDQVRAGLRLYVITANLIRNAIDPDHTDVIENTVTLIESAGLSDE